VNKATGCDSANKVLTVKNTDIDTFHGLYRYLKGFSLSVLIHKDEDLDLKKVEYRY
jgi:hypothetical protein